MAPDRNSATRGTHGGARARSGRPSKPTNSNTDQIAAFFLPRRTNQPVPATNFHTFYSASNPEAQVVPAEHADITVSPQDFATLQQEFTFISENDEYGDIARGDVQVEESLVDDLPGAPEKFKCHNCGESLTRNGFNDNPIARRVRSMPNDFFLFTNRFICDNRREGNKGCGRTMQGTDPIILSQLPRFTQLAFPAYITARGAISKTMMWQMRNTFATRFGPAPFSDLVSEIQTRYHAECELMYLDAAKFYHQKQEFHSSKDVLQTLWQLIGYILNVILQLFL
ncbi:hypothetical protein MIND_01319700 [Mycena indigotica]|uniref:Uncharacterized protein n=1 Tax=Mycena indigotica TaxID=2126181 RepID=A0A8H6S185_9AGAR|nr:uncharacterized protein MIND_01319700 [Mycena indigotica]KAF7290788.1 hypothetical protein MIND_01319700 [Mycena indigotica]